MNVTTPILEEWAFRLSWSRGMASDLVYEHANVTLQQGDTHAYRRFVVTIVLNI